MEQVNKTYFSSGDLVRLNKPLDFIPIMYVVRKEMSFLKKEGKSSLLGIKCRWFDKNYSLHEAIFDTKDLELLN